mgnify:CR=1 FL=1
MKKPYEQYKESDLFSEVESITTEDRMLRFKTNLDIWSAKFEGEGDTIALQQIRYAIKHLARKFQHIKFDYKLVAVNHIDKVLATHEEKAKFVFHLKYPHTQYRVVSVSKV